MRPTQLTGPLGPHPTRADPSTTMSLAALLLTAIAIALAVVSFGVLAAPPAVLAAALSLIAVVVLVLDVADVGDVANRVVDRAR